MKPLSHIILAVISLVGPSCALAGPFEFRALADKLKLSIPAGPAVPAAPAARTYAELDYATRTGDAILTGYGTWGPGSVSYIRSSIAETESFYFEVQNPDGRYVDVGMTMGAANTSFFEMDHRGDVYVKNGDTYTLAARYGLWTSRTVGLAWNASRKEVTVYYDGVAAGTLAYPHISGPVYPTVYSNGGVIKINFGQEDFGPRVPQGYKAGSYR